MRTTRMTMALVALVGLLLSVYLTLFKLGKLGELACGTGGCETVQLSRWGTLMGAPVAAWGTIFYLAVLVLAIAGAEDRFIDSPFVRHALLAVTGWGLLFSAYLTSLEAWVIHAWCRWCLGSAAITLVLFALAVVDWRRVGREA